MADLEMVITRTEMGSSSAIILGGTLLPQSLINLWKEAYVWIGIIPGMTGTVIPCRGNIDISSNGFWKRPTSISDFMKPS